MEFFTFYRDIKVLEWPFITFSLWHFLFLGMLVIGIVVMLQYYKGRSDEQKRKFQIHMAMYFLAEEALYTLWLLFTCHHGLLLEIIPLQLCSLCVYVSIITVYTKRSDLQFFCGIVDTLAGLAALLYPANITELYPVFSYRTINFFMLHGAFVLFGFIQLQERSLLIYKNITRCTFMLTIMFTTAFLANIVFHTDYMFVAIPPKIGFINMVYHITGMILFLPAVILCLILIQYIAVYVFKHTWHFYGNKESTMKINVTD